MELRQVFSIVWKWMWLVVLSVLVAATSSFLVSRAATPLFRTKTTLMVGRVIQNPDPNSMDLYTGQQLALTYIQLTKREPVLKGALESLGLKDMDWQMLGAQVSASIVAQTQLIDINVIDSNPYRAKALADAVAKQMELLSPSASSGLSTEQATFIQDQVNDLQVKIKDAQGEVEKLRIQRDAAVSSRQVQDFNNQMAVWENKISDWQNTFSQLLLSLKGGDTNTISVVEEAAIPTYPFSPNVPMNVITAAVIGFVLALGGAFLIEYLDDTVKTPEDIERISKLATLGAITQIEGDEYPDKLISIRQPRSPITEAYRVLRTNIQYSSIDKPIKTLLMTSPGPGEGKSVTLANLASVIAQSGLKVILVDTDLRRPSQHKVFGLSNRRGLTDAILHPLPGISEFLQKTELENLRLLTTGPLPPNPAELLTSVRMGELIEELKNQADMVLFDSPPSLIVADAAILGSKVDGVILVNDAGRTRTAAARRAVDEMHRVRAHLLGIILNRLSANGDGFMYPYYYYYYYDDGDHKGKRKSSRNWLKRQLPMFDKPSDKARKN
jgi:polysaccharide biosynthesis transport protein